MCHLYLFYPGTEGREWHIPKSGWPVTCGASGGQSPPTSSSATVFSHECLSHTTLLPWYWLLGLWGTRVAITLSATFLTTLGNLNQFVTHGLGALSGRGPGCFLYYVALVWSMWSSPSTPAPADWIGMVTQRSSSPQAAGTEPVLAQKVPADEMGQSHPIYFPGIWRGRCRQKHMVIRCLEGHKKERPCGTRSKSEL